MEEIIIASPKQAEKVENFPDPMVKDQNHVLEQKPEKPKSQDSEGQRVLFSFAGYGPEDFPFACKFCEKRFCHKRTLVKHNRAHRPFSCSVCKGVRFKSEQELFFHLKMHAEKKTYSCDSCGKHFKSLSKLKWHLVTHSTERPFRCTVCGKGFKRKGNMKVHLIGVHGDKLC